MSSKIFKRTKILATIGPVSGNGNQQMLEDMIMAAVNEAFRQMEDAGSQAMSKLTGGLGGMGGGFPF